MSTDEKVGLGKPAITHMVDNNETAGYQQHIPNTHSTLLQPAAKSQRKSQTHARQTQTKRNYRARQRAYVKELQQKVDERRVEQVEGMREVQLAAQKVVGENERLRGLLRVVDVRDDIVDAWVRGDEGLARECIVEKGVRSRGRSYEVSQMPEKMQTSDVTAIQSDPTCPRPISSRLTFTPTLPSPESTDRSSSISSARNRPCMSVQHVLNPPSTKEMKGASRSMSEEESDDGIECSKAQDMVNHFATSEAKLEAMAEKMKSSCVGDRKGGCKVKSTAMWDILETAMNEEELVGPDEKG
ncbi:MAG: hypothetical protein M1814_006456 [Vezdaea aestivalis]|nr:MAG: hypothetical protein M1814_006456 [Vezdaea aestivalis]